MEDGTLTVGKFPVWLSLLAGAMDTATGVFLIAAPALTLNLMGLSGETAPTAYLQFIGAFVFAIGSLYLWGFCLLARKRLLEWRVIWIATAWARFCVGITVGFLILIGRLPVMWISVPLADLGLAMVQVLYLRGVWKRDG